MNKHMRHIAALAFTIALAGSGHAATGHAHEHGAVKLDIAVEPGKITLQMESPLDSIVGFERAPRSAAERKKVDAAVAALKAADTLFKIDPAAGCKLANAELVSAPLGLGQPDPAAKAEEGHADLDGDFEFTCTNSARAGFIELGLFSTFIGMQRVDVQIATPKGQAKRTLKRPAARIELPR